MNEQDIKKSIRAERVRALLRSEGGQELLAIIDEEISDTFAKWLKSEKENIWELQVQGRTMDLFKSKLFQIIKNGDDARSKSE